MTLFDVVIVAVVVLSSLLALMRGFVREVIALGAWIAGLVLAFMFAAPLAAQFESSRSSPVVAEVLAFAAIFVGVLIVGGIIAAVLSGAIRAAGLGGVDRVLGGAFGVLRGLAFVLLFVLVAGLSGLPQREWWQNSALAPSLAALALQFRDFLPSAWAGRLDFSPGQPRSKSGVMRV